MSWSFDDAVDVFRDTLTARLENAESAEALTVLLARFRTYVSMQFPLLLSADPQSADYAALLADLRESFADIRASIDILESKPG